MTEAVVSISTGSHWVNGHTPAVEHHGGATEVKDEVGISYVPRYPLCLWMARETEAYSFENGRRDPTSECYPSLCLHMTTLNHCQQIVRWQLHSPLQSLLSSVKNLPCA